MTTVITDEKLNLINAQRRAAGRPILGKADAIYLMERRRNAVRANTGRDERSDNLMHYLIAYSFLNGANASGASEKSKRDNDDGQPFPATIDSYESSSSSSSASGGSSGGDSGGGGE